MQVGPELTEGRVLSLANTVAGDALASTGFPPEWYGQHDRYLMPPPPPHQFWCNAALSGRPVAEAAHLSQLQRAIDSGYELEQADFLDYMKLRGLADLYFFCKYLMGFKLLDRRFHGALAWAWQAPNGWETPWGQVYDKFRMAVVARGHYKTTELTQGACMFDAVRDTEQRLLIFTHALDFSVAVMSVVKDLCEGVGAGADLFLHCYGDLIPSVELRGKKVKWDQQNLTFVRQGRYTDPTIYAGAIDAKTTGRHFTKQYVDDLVGEEMSRTRMQKVLKQFDNLDPLYHSLKLGERRMVGTPWSFLDPISYAVKHWKRAMVARVPWRLPDGELTIPTCDVDEALRIKRKNAWFFSCQYEVWPEEQGKLGFQREWFRYFKYIRKGMDTSFVALKPDGSEERAVPAAACNFFLLIDPNTGRVPGERVTIDANAPKSREHDYAGFVVVAVDKDNNQYVVRVIRWRCNPKELIDKTFELVSVWRPKFVAIETIAAQRLFLYLFAMEFKRGRAPFTLREWKGGHASKEERIKGLIPYYSNGMILHRECDREAEAAGIQALEGELEDFPNAEYDDLSDALSAGIQLVYAPGKEQGDRVEDEIKAIRQDARWATLGPFARQEAESWARKKRKGVLIGDEVLLGQSTDDYEAEDMLEGLVNTEEFANLGRYGGH